MNLPTPQQLRYLVALAETGHVGRAAAACAVTQSTLSAGLLALEHMLGARLLDRESGRRPAFTPLGLEVLGRARAALAALEAVAETALAGGRAMGGVLRLGVIPTIGPFLLPRLMPLLRARFPVLRLFLREDATARLLEQLRARRLDLLVLALPCPCGEGNEVMPIGRDEFLLALPAGHPLGARAEVAPAALAAERLRDQALAACRPGGEGTAPADAEDFAATSLHTLAQMVAGGLGVTLLPRLAVAAGIAAGTDIQLRGLAGPEGWRTVALAWRTEDGRAADYRGLAPLLAGLVSGA